MAKTGECTALVTMTHTARKGRSYPGVALGAALGLGFAPTKLGNALVLPRDQSDQVARLLRRSRPVLDLCKRPRKARPAASAGDAR